MARGSSTALSRDIRTLFDDGTAVGLSDRQLLDRFAGRRDPSAEAAFEALVRRHGPMVLRVCQNVLHDPNDAHDAFQATFLVLVRRSGALRGLDSLGGWLYGVACRVSARARVDAARRRALECRAALRVVEAFEPADAMERDDFGPIVQEEVRRLPQKYRAAVVLCYWEGLTHEQAAGQLGCPLGTVRSRLARARDLLRRRLTRRGIEPMAVGLDSIRRLPPLAPELVQSTVQAALGFAAGRAASPVISAAVASLVQRMLWRTIMIKLSGVVAGGMLVGLAGYGAGLAAQRTGGAEAPRRASADHDKPVDGPGGSSGTGQAAAEAIPGAAPQKGERKASPPQLVYANVEIETSIVKIVPDGAMVKKGEAVCELNSGVWRDQLVDQRISVQAAEAAGIGATLDREVAEVGVREYVDGEYVDQLLDVEGTIKLAEAELELAELELKGKKATNAADSIPIKRADLSLDRARFSLEKARSRKKLLVHYTRDKKVKELESAVKKARADERARQTTFSSMVQKEANLEKQIRNCTIVASMDGRVRYIFTQGNPIGAGFPVRPRALLFAIDPLDQAAPPRDPAPGAGGGPLR